MYQRSKKYILLLVLNIAILVAWYIQQEEPQAAVFDTEYVIDLIDKVDKAQASIDERQGQIISLNNQIRDYEQQLAMLDADNIEASQRSNQCKQEKALLESQLDLALETAKTEPSSLMECSEQVARLDNFQRQVTLAQTRVDELIVENAQLRRDLVLSEQRLKEIADNDEIELLRARVKQLEQDIENPIYLQSVYFSDRQCEPPRADELVCITEFLIRPEFSKAPQGRVTVNIYSQDDRNVASGEFVSKRAQLLRVAVRGESELEVGNYRAEFNVDGEVLVSDPYMLARK